MTQKEVFFMLGLHKVKATQKSCPSCGSRLQRIPRKSTTRYLICHGCGKVGKRQEVEVSPGKA